MVRQQILSRATCAGIPALAASRRADPAKLSERAFEYGAGPGTIAARCSPPGGC